MSGLQGIQQASLLKAATILADMFVNCKYCALTKGNQLNSGFSTWGMDQQKRCTHLAAGPSVSHNILVSAHPNAPAPSSDRSANRASLLPPIASPP